MKDKANCPGWLEPDAFRVPVFSTPKTCREVGTDQVCSTDAGFLIEGGLTLE